MDSSAILYVLYVLCVFSKDTKDIKDIKDGPFTLAPQSPAT